MAQRSPQCPFPPPRTGAQADLPVKLPSLSSQRVSIQAALGRVFVRSALHIVLLLLMLTGIMAVAYYKTSVNGVEHSLIREARHHAELAASLLGKSIEAGDVATVQMALNAMADDEHVQAIRGYDSAGRLLSDISFVHPGSELSVVEQTVLEALAQRTPQLKNGSDSLTFALPVLDNSRAIGAIAVKMSKATVLQTERDVIWQTAFLAGILFLAVGPMAAFLLYRTTRGISDVTDAANEAAQGFLNTKLETTGVGEVAELQDAFRQMAINLRSNIQRIEYLAHFDEATGLPNRVKFSNTATQLIDLSPQAEGSLLFVDLDRFKAINDMHGHAVGDRLLTLVGARLTEIVENFLKDEDFAFKPFVARFTGDEFIVILPGLTDYDALQTLAEIIGNKISAPFKTDNLKLVLNASIGVALYPQDGQTADDILRCADMAMFSAKQAGRDRTVFFNESIRQKALERDKIEACIRTALKNNELSVFYQPKVEIKSGRIIGSEALLRWHHPELGAVPPWKFIPVAEECGLMTSIGEFVLHRSLEDMKILRREGQDLTVAVNVAPVQFSSAYFTDRTLGILGESGFPLDRLELEITESGVMEDPERVRAQIMPIKEEGVQFAIDDFGTGYSSLNTLATMPFDTLKIDRSFVMDMAVSEDRRAIVQLILSMAQQLNMKTVAEGIETTSQYDHLRAWGATYAQGYLWSPPVEFAAFRDLAGQTSAAGRKLQTLHA